jgi:acyl-CoA synthetase (AMP-forming)/AMP-acid ligase II
MRARGGTRRGSRRSRRQFCGQHLVRYKVPSEFQFVAELPKTTVGKIDRKRLKELS